MISQAVGMEKEWVYERNVPLSNKTMWFVRLPVPEMCRGRTRGGTQEVFSQNPTDRWGGSPTFTVSTFGHKDAEFGTSASQRSDEMGATGGVGAGGGQLPIGGAGSGRPFQPSHGL